MLAARPPARAQITLDLGQEELNFPYFKFFSLFLSQLFFDKKISAENPLFLSLMKYN